jgi:hypothetical protein
VKVHAFATHFYVDVLYTDKKHLRTWKGTDSQKNFIKEIKVSKTAYPGYPEYGFPTG